MNVFTGMCVARLPSLLYSVMWRLETRISHKAEWLFISGILQSTPKADSMYFLLSVCFAASDIFGINLNGANKHVKTCKTVFVRINYVCVWYAFWWNETAHLCMMHKSWNTQNSHSHTHTHKLLTECNPRLCIHFRWSKTSSHALCSACRRVSGMFCIRRESAMTIVSVMPIECSPHCLSSCCCCWHRFRPVPWYLSHSLQNHLRVPRPHRNHPKIHEIYRHIFAKISTIFRHWIWTDTWIQCKWDGVATGIIRYTHFDHVMNVMAIAQHTQPQGQQQWQQCNKYQKTTGGKCNVWIIAIFPMQKFE